jgi:hypothetical protein
MNDAESEARKRDDERRRKAAEQGTAKAAEEQRRKTVQEATEEQQFDWNKIRWAIASAEAAIFIALCLFGFVAHAR